MIVCSAQHPWQGIEECVGEFTFLGKDDRNAALAKPKKRIRANKYAGDHYLRHAVSFEERQLPNNGIGAVDPKTDKNNGTFLRHHYVSQRHEPIKIVMDVFPTEDNYRLHAKIGREHASDGCA